MRFYSYPNRTLCDVLAEMRKCYEVRNFSNLIGLIEEAQSMGNRMEAALSDKQNCEDWAEKRRKLKKEIRELKEKKQKLGGSEDDED